MQKETASGDMTSIVDCPDCGTAQDADAMHCEFPYSNRAELTLRIRTVTVALDAIH